ncbi:ATP-binding protein [Nocardioides sp. Kera G14]|uniref:ATP-binding protein n=1 Tax=Nocardioides sp. Kera G14 TaxID=2884264 RepID=UPI001D12EB3D|nr:ATP-binding protein [Nocardioides sp. Kera G14]UDY23646.1 ATP-binding protein [Nocardioides sp. Kera G14]
MRVFPPARVADDVWWRVEDDAAVASVRRAATALANQLRFDESRVGEVGIVVTELATNLRKHAGGGELVLRSPHGTTEGLRILAIDSGPGSRNIDALISDGASTRGTLGIGLGACVRLSNRFDVFSVPAVGTIAEAVLAGTAPPTSPVAGTVAVRADTLTRPLGGEGACGDIAVYRDFPGGLIGMLSDGLGHGPLAADASRRAAELMLESELTSPGALLERMHAALGSTRGAAISLLRYDDATRTVTHAGVGNVVTRLFGADSRTLPSQPGIVGHRMPRLRELAVPLTGRSTAVLHSDGIRQQWSFDDLPGALGHEPGVLCATVMRAAATRRDDASVLVVEMGRS